MQTVQQTMEISQVPFLALLLTRPLLCNDRCLGSTVDTFSASVYGGLYGRFLMYST